MKRILVFVLMFCITVCSLSSCASKNTISVTSPDYPSLTKMIASSFDREQAQLATLPEYPYNDYQCVVSEENGVLCIRSQSQADGSYQKGFDNGYFLGVDMGEFDGWVKYYPYYTNVTGDSDVRLVSNENCCGIIKRNNQNGYILTGTRSTLSTMPSAGSVYVIHYSQDVAAWTWETKISLDGFPIAYYFSEGAHQLLIVTDQSILRITEQNEVETLIKSDLIKQIHANSIVCMDGIIYCGSPLGVYSFDPSNGVEAWYPMDYEKHVK